MDNKNFICDEKCIHYNKITKIKQPSREQISKLSDIFKIFADETRLRIICNILNTELCVCDLCEVLNLNQSTVSHQLQLLRNSKLVKHRREGKQIYYSLNDEHVDCIIRMGIAHILEKKEE